MIRNEKGLLEILLALGFLTIAAILSYFSALSSRIQIEDRAKLVNNREAFYFGELLSLSYFNRSISGGNTVFCGGATSCKKSGSDAAIPLDGASLDLEYLPAWPLPSIVSSAFAETSTPPVKNSATSAIMPMGSLVDRFNGTNSFYRYSVDSTSGTGNFCSGLTFGRGSRSKEFDVCLNVPPEIAADLQVNGSNGPTISAAFNSTASLNWTSTSANACTVTPGALTGTSGSATSPPLTVTTTFTLTCTDTAAPPRSKSDSIQVNIPVPSADLKVNGGDSNVSISGGSTVLVNWTSYNTSSCSLNTGGMPGITATTGTSNAGQTSSALNTATVYTLVLTCTGGVTSVTDVISVTVLVTNPTVDLRINGGNSPVSVNKGSNVNVSWTSTNAPAGCTLTPSVSGIGTGQSGGPRSKAVSSATTFKVVCRDNASPQKQAQDTIAVSLNSISCVAFSSASTAASGTCSCNCCASSSCTSTNLCYLGNITSQHPHASGFGCTQQCKSSFGVGAPCTP